MKVEIWDQRRCQVGEGPVAIGANHNDIWWVDIYNSKVLYRNAESGATDEYTMPEHVSFIIPCVDGSDLLGTANGPVRRRKDGSIEKLPTRAEVNGSQIHFQRDGMMPRLHRTDISGSVLCLMAGQKIPTLVVSIN